MVNGQWAQWEDAREGGRFQAATIDDECFCPIAGVLIG
jgi:uncharacterized protein (DUF952 family)